MFPGPLGPQLTQLCVPSPQLLQPGLVRGPGSNAHCGAEAQVRDHVRGGLPGGGGPHPRGAGRTQGEDAWKSR